MSTGAGDPFSLDAGAYVLGALPPAEREAFEEHLAGCAGCRGAVEDLAGLPGLLSRVPAEAVAAPDEGAAAPLRAPGTLLPQLLRTVRARRRRRRLLLAGGAVAACLLTGAGAVALLPDPGAAGPARSLEPLLPVPLTATAQLTEAAWGTQVDLVCAYASDGAEEASTYALVVTDTDGNDQRIGTWTAHPGRDARLSGATALTPEQIAAVEVRTLQGTAVLRLDEAAAGS
ncbi:anti-sigma factor [Kineococcus sp. SYSU DK018]|uniref:anti-sigma factor n=1 Tax=Kineococcus sp. SYSU DK018 TaxID=3383139 RepID=UPI003D7C8C70